MRLPQLQKMAEKFFSDNASSILTGVGMVGVVGTAVLTHRAAVKASYVINEERERRTTETIPDAIEGTEMVGMVWKFYVPPVALGAATIASIYGANRMSAQKAAALAAAYGISESRFAEYKEKTLEKLGVKKETDLRAEIAQDRVSKDESSQVIILTDGDVLCYDLLTGRYFRSSVEKIRKAENKLNQELMYHEYASLSSFFDDVGLEATQYTDEVGWNQATDGVVEVKFSTTTSTDDRPCIAIEFATPPHPSYHNQY